MKKISFLVFLMMGLVTQGLWAAAPASCRFQNSNQCRTEEGFLQQVTAGCATPESNCVKKFCANNCRMSSCNQELCQTYCSQFSQVRESSCLASKDELSPGAKRALEESKKRRASVESTIGEVSARSDRRVKADELLKRLDREIAQQTSLAQEYNANAEKYVRALKVAHSYSKKLSTSEKQTKQSQGDIAAQISQISRTYGDISGVQDTLNRLQQQLPQLVDWKGQTDHFCNR